MNAHSLSAPNPWPAMVAAAATRSALWGSASAALALLWTPAMPSPISLNAALVVALFFWQAWRASSRMANGLDAARLLPPASRPAGRPWARLVHHACLLDWMAAPLLISVGAGPSSWGPFRSQACSGAQAIAKLWFGW